MKKVFYKIIGRGAGYTSIRFWMSPDESDAFTDTFVRVEDAKLQNYVKNKLNVKQVKLVQVV